MSHAPPAAPAANDRIGRRSLGSIPRRFRSILALKDFERAARRRLPRPLFGYVSGGVEEEVFASLCASYPGIDWHELAVKMRLRVGRHGARRSAEMREAASMVKALGLDDSLCEGIADVQASFAGR